MIVHHHHMQALECSVCHTAVELRRTVAEAPELLAMMKQEMARDHEPCELYPDNPTRAAAERKYCAGMREAFKDERRPTSTRPMFARCRRTR